MPLSISNLPCGVISGRCIMSQPSIRDLSFPKKAFTVIDIRAWITENYDKLINSYISNVFFIPEEKIYLFKLWSRNLPSGMLLLQPSVRIHFTNMKIESSTKTSSEVTRIRQLVRDKKIVGISQIGFDRIVEINLHDGFKIILEILPRGELIITDEKNVIRYASEYKRMKDRKIVFGQLYEYPPLITNLPNLEDCLNNLDALKGLPKEIILESKTRGEDPCKNIQLILQESLQGKKGYIAYHDEKAVFFSPFRPTFLEKSNLTVEEKGSFNEAVDEYYSMYTTKLVADLVTKNIKDTIEKLTTTVEIEKKRAQEFIEKANNYKKMADFMMLNKDIIDEILLCIKNTIDTKGWEKVASECNYVFETMPNEGKVIVKMDDMELTLDVRATSKEIITNFYEEYKRYKHKYEKAIKTITELEKAIQEQKIELERKKSETLFRVKKSYWYEKYIWSFTRNKLLIIAGKDAQQNESIVKKYLDKEDYFFHADIHGAAATVLKILPGYSVTDEDIADASVIAASFSKAWKAGYASVDVFYVRGEQVSKTPPAGEYITTGSFMIYGKKNFVKNVVLELAIGIEYTEDGIPRFTIGSTESILKRGELLGYLYPGENPPNKIAERIRKRLKEKEYQYIPAQTEIEKLIPGPSKIKFID